MVPASSAKNESGDFERFQDFARRVVSVPHAEIKARLEAEKAAKRKPNAASRAPAFPSKKR